MGHMSMLPDDCYPPPKKPTPKRPKPVDVPKPVTLDDTASECSTPDASSSSSASDGERRKPVARTSSSTSVGVKSMSSFSGGEGRDSSERREKKRHRMFPSVGYGSSHPDYDECDVGHD